MSYSALVWRYFGYDRVHRIVWGLTVPLHTSDSKWGPNANRLLIYSHLNYFYILPVLRRCSSPEFVI